MLPSSFKQRLEEGWEVLTSQMQGVHLFPITVTRKSKFHDEICPRPIPHLVGFNNDERLGEEMSEERRDRLQSSEMRSRSQTPLRSRTPTPVKSRSPHQNPSRLPSPNEAVLRDPPSSIFAAPMAVKVNPSCIVIPGHTTKDINSNFSSRSGLEGRGVQDQRELRRLRALSVPRTLMYDSNSDLDARETTRVFPEERLSKDLSSNEDKYQTSRVREESVNSERNMMREDTHRNFNKCDDALLRTEDEMNGNASRIASRRQRSTDSFPGGQVVSGVSGRFRGASGNEQAIFPRNGKRGSYSQSNTNVQPNRKGGLNLDGKRSVPQIHDNDLTARLHELINRRGRDQESATSLRRSSDVLRHHHSSSGRIRRMSSTSNSRVHLTNLHSKSVPRFILRRHESQTDQRSNTANARTWKSSELLNFAYRDVMEMRGMRDAGHPDESRPESAADEIASGQFTDVDVCKRLAALEETVADLARSQKSQSQKLSDIMGMMDKQESRHEHAMARLDDVVKMISTALEEIKDIKHLEAQVLKLTVSQAHPRRDQVQQSSNTNYKKVTFKGINDQ